MLPNMKLYALQLVEEAVVARLKLETVVLGKQVSNAKTLILETAAGVSLDILPEEVSYLGAKIEFLLVNHCGEE